MTGTAGSYSGADFTISTLNLGYVDWGMTGIIGNTFTDLTPNTDYVFEVFFSDNHGGRGARFGYAIGGSGMRFSAIEVGTSLDA